MREIKFRQFLKGKYRVNGDSFHYFGYIDGGFTGPVGKNISSCQGEQYTGLKDINGVEIYEGDIVLCRVTIEVDRDQKEFSYYNTDENGVRTKHCCKPKPAVAGYDKKGGIEYKHKSGASCSGWLTKSSEVEIIGNIHETPELLEANDGA